METQWILELIGYVASALVAISLMMSSVLRLRLINLFGSAAFTLYGVLIHAYPVAVVNALIVLINIFYLYRMLTANEYFRLLVLRPDSDYLRYFLRFYKEEIRRILPDFRYTPLENQITLFILRDCNPAGVFIAEEKRPGVLHVRLDFVIPRYRDLKIGRFLFCEQADFFRERRIKEIVVSPRSREFSTYLRVVGFIGPNDAQGPFRLTLEGEPEEPA